MPCIKYIDKMYLNETVYASQKIHDLNTVNYNILWHNYHENDIFNNIVIFLDHYRVFEYQTAIIRNKDKLLIAVL